jgi:alcohol dehydrogenase class IV
MVTFLNIPSTVVAGHGALNELANQVRRIGGANVLLVTDKFMVQSGLAARVAQQMEAANIEVTIYSDIQPDPTVRNVLDGLEVFRASSAQIIVALGGGSPLDAAKAISILTTNPPPLNQYMGYHKIPHPGAPLIAIPTTAGTGS